MWIRSQRNTSSPAPCSCRTHHLIPAHRALRLHGHAAGNRAKTCLPPRSYRGLARDVSFRFYFLDQARIAQIVPRHAEEFHLTARSLPDLLWILIVAAFQLLRETSRLNIPAQAALFSLFFRAASRVQSGRASGLGWKRLNPGIRQEFRRSPDTAILPP